MNLSIIIDKLSVIGNAGLAQSKDGRKTDMLRFSPLNLFNKEWDKLLSQDVGLLGSKDTEDLDWEVVDHGGWVDISMVEQVGQLEHGRSEQLLVGPDSAGLDHLDQLLQHFLGWVPDVTDGDSDQLGQE